MKDGLLLVDKDGGGTSHDVVVAARRLLRQKKIGHCGTLDPTATGLLLLTVGRATRLTRFLINAPKVYTGTAQLGVVTDTYDTAGKIMNESSIAGIDSARVDDILQSFVGTYLQTPPPYCAKKIGGVKYYELARRGEEVPKDKKEVNIYRCGVTSELDRQGEVSFVLGCSSGTYARSIVHEMGEKLGCGATLAGLRRTGIGPFELDDALRLEEIGERLAAGSELGSAWLPFDDIPLPFPQVEADRQQERRVQQGQSVLVRGLECQEGDWIKLVDSRARFIAIGSVVERIAASNIGVVQPKVVFR